MAHTSATKLTCDEFFAMFPGEDEGVCRELIDGEVVVTPNPVTRHQQLVVRLTVSLGNYFEAHPGHGELLTAPFDVVLSLFDVVVPDLLVVLNEQAKILTEKNAQGAPAVVVEILSPSTRKRDLTVKRQLYDREGVREYWIVDPVKNVITIHRRSADGSLPVATILDTSAKVTLETPLLPGWSLSMDHLFR